MRLRLRAIRYGCDFRKNEVTLMEELRRDAKYKGVGALKSGEAVLLVSQGENQLLWVFAGAGIHTRGGEDIVVVDSRRWRLPRSGWNPAMLSEYAAVAGIELIGIRMFESAYKDERERRHNLRTLSDYAHEATPSIAAAPAQ